MDEQRARRLGLNEAIFREVNERLEQLATSTVGVADLLDLVCECANSTCTERIRVEWEDYEAARANGATFLVAEGHVIPEIERVLQKRAGYDLIEKSPGGPREVAEQTDPRA